jgi:hypothetical protein
VHKNCAKHPLLRAHIIPGQTIDVEISPQEFFAHATLKLQNSRIKGKQSFRQTKKKWHNILEREGDYLSFTKNDLVASSAAGTEDLTDLSAVVGIGCGLIALGHAFDVQINRFSRFTPTNQIMRRMDFEFIAKGRRYFHESKGTTSKYTGNKNRKDILEQKKSTKKYCAKNGPSLAGSTGSIVVYRKAKAPKGSTTIMLIDPPADGDGVASRTEELISVLKYYQNIYAVTHTDFTESRSNGPRRLSIATWLARVALDLNNGGAPPDTSPDRLEIKPRASELGNGDSRYSGTIFDERLRNESVLRYPSFDAATAAIRSPVRFIGLSEEVTSLITSCRWDRLLEYSDSAVSAQSIVGTAILTSGLMVRDLPRTEEIEVHSRREFELLRKIALKMESAGL